MNIEERINELLRQQLERDTYPDSAGERDRAENVAHYCAALDHLVRANNPPVYHVSTDAPIKLEFCCCATLGRARCPMHGGKTLHFPEGFPQECTCVIGSESGCPVHS